MTEHKPATGTPLLRLAGGMLLFILLAALTNVLARRLMLTHNPYFVGFWRFTLAVPALGLLLRAQGRKILLLPVDRWRFVVLALLVVPGNQLLFLIAMRYAPASHAALMYATTPAWVLLLTLALGIERLRVWKLTGIALAIAGVVIVLMGQGFDLGSEVLKGDVILLGAVATWSVYTAISKPLVERYGPLEATFLVMAFGGLLYLPIGIPAAILTDYSTVTLADWGSLIYMGVFTSGMAYFVWFWLVDLLRPTQVAIVTTALPPATILLAWLLIGESLTPNFILGGLITLVGIVVAIVGGGGKHTLRRDREVMTPVDGRAI